MYSATRRHTYEALQEEVRRARDDETLCQNSPVESSACNGMLGRSIREVECTIRNITFGLEHHFGRQNRLGEPKLAWLAEHVANLLNKYHAGVDGLTPYRRLHGTDVDEEMVEFGEQVMHLFLKRPG